MDIVHCIVNNLGGITTLTQNLIIFDSQRDIEQKILCLDITDNKNQPGLFSPLVLKSLTKFKLNPLENWYKTFGALAAALSDDDGLLITNDQFDLIMLEAFNIPRKIIQLVHDPYNIQLSKKYHHVIDGFIAHNKEMYDQLIYSLPQRKEDIYYQPYGIPVIKLPVHTRAEDAPLKLIFIGRHDKGKGVYELYIINEHLKAKGILVEWTILGKGPETEGLKEQWGKEDNVVFHLAKDNDEVLRYATDCDILIFPTKFEGSPLALLEAMSVGCIPIVTNIPGGISETIENGINGFKCEVNAIDEFVASIEKMHNNRNELNEIKIRCKETILKKFDICKNTNEYTRIFKFHLDSNYAPRHHSVNRKIGSRLDQKWLPDFFVLLLRKVIYFIKRPK